MRIAALVCLTAGLVLPAKAWGEQTRVVFCAERTGVCATLQPLGRTAGGFWAKVSDTELLASRNPLPVLLYANTAELNEALARLDDKGREEAIACRLEYLTQHPEAWVRDMLKTDMREVAATMADATAPELALVLDADVERGGRDACALVHRPDDALRLIREDLAHLVVELPEGPLAVGYGQESTALAELHRPYIRLAKDGDEVPMPFAEPMPAYFVPSVSDQDFRALADSRGSPHRWRGGVVAVLSPRDLKRPPLKGQAVRMLYLGEQLYLNDLANLSSAQLNLRFQARMKRIPANERVTLVARMAFSHAKWFRLLTLCLEKKKASWLPRWRQIAALADENLRSALRAAYPEAGRRRSTRLRELRADLALAAVLMREGEDRARLERVRKMLTSLPP
jgi:hypothetical protein